MKSMKLTNLPKIEHPTFAITLPVSKKKLRFRPFLKRDDHILLTALETGKEDEMYEATKQIIYNCITSGEVNVDRLPLLDVQYFFLQLRKHSAGELIKLFFTCKNEVDGKICDTQNGVSIEIDKILETFKEPHKDFNIIEIAPGIWFKMKYPSFELTKKLTINNAEQNPDFVLHIYANLIDQIFTESDTFEEIDETDAINYLKDLDLEQFTKLEKFIDSIPTFNYTHKFICKKCDYHEDYTINSFESFFV